VQRELNEKLVRYNTLKSEIADVEREVAELRHGIRVLGGVPVEAGGSPPATVMPPVKSMDIGEIIGTMMMSNHAVVKIGRNVIRDIMTIISKMPDDAKFRAGHIRESIDRYYPDIVEVSRGSIVTGYLKFLIDKKVILHNGKKGPASMYMKAPRIKSGEPGGVDVAKMLEQERQLQRDVQGK
jgi:hypothetical protein